MVKELKKAMETHIINSFDIDYLHKYEKGVQPILHRVKDVRPTINNSGWLKTEPMHFTIKYQFPTAADHSGTSQN